jgi:hypothetical protein
MSENETKERYVAYGVHFADPDDLAAAMLTEVVTQYDATIAIGLEAEDDDHDHCLIVVRSNTATTVVELAKVLQVMVDALMNGAASELDVELTQVEADESSIRYRGITDVVDDLP